MAAEGPPRVPGVPGVWGHWSRMGGWMCEVGPAAAAAWVPASEPGGERGRST